MNKKLLTSTIAAMLLTGIFILLFSTPLTTGQMKSEYSDFKLTELWKQYDKASQADKPKTQLEILEKIKNEAKEKRLHWDFYQAAEMTTDIARRINWKEAQKYDEQKRADIQAYNEPVVSLEFASRHYEALSPLIEREERKLKEGHNKVFWNNCYQFSDIMSGYLSSYIKDDYEYALWLQWSRNTEDSEKLQAYTSDYPGKAWIEYSRAYDKKDEKQLRDIAAKYKGKGVGMWAEYSLLCKKWNELNEDKKSTSDDFRDFENLCKKHNEKIASLDAAERKIAKDASAGHLIEVLNSKEVDISVVDSNIVVRFKNLSTAEVKIYPEGSTRALHNLTVNNSKCSFFITDEEKTALPLLDDGEYIISAKAEKEKDQTTFLKYSISLAHRGNSEGRGIYAADWKSGKPLQAGTLTKDKMKVSDNFAISEGFTQLPEDEDWDGRNIQFSFKDGDIIRKSKSLYIGYNRTVSNTVSPQNRANVFLDRAAFRPGETVQFAAVLWRTDERRKLSALEGKEITAKLIDRKGKTAGDPLKLKANQFGSVSGSFLIPEGLENGIFEVAVYDGQKELGSKTLRVDEFLLPSFDLEFDKSDKAVFPGDTLIVSGKITSYSGHSLAGIQTSYETEVAGTVSKENLEIGADGRFSIALPIPSDYNWYSVNVKVLVTDNTGETLEFSKFTQISKYIDLWVDIKNKCEEDEIGDFYTTVSVAEKTLECVFDISNSQSDKIEGELSYSLYNEKEELCFSAQTRSGKTVFLELPAPGLYELRAEVSYSEDIKDSLSKNIVFFPSDAEVMAAPIDYLFRPAEETAKVEALLAAGNGQIWAIMELYGMNRDLLEKRVIALKGKRGEEGSVERISYEWKEEWPEKLSMNLFWFKNGEEVSFSHIFNKNEASDLDLPLSFESFTDKTLPGSPCTLILKTLPESEAIVSVFDKSTETIMPNGWSVIRQTELQPQNLKYSAVTGQISGENDIFVTRAFKGSSNAAMMLAEDDVVFEESAALPMMTAQKSSDAAYGESDEAPKTEALSLRSDFAKTLTFQSGVASDSEGIIRIPFKTSDQLSTFVVSVFAHNKQMKNALLRKEMLVSLPLKVSVVEPAFLYTGDKYNMAVSVSSMAEESQKGRLELLEYFNGEEIRRQSIGMSLAPKTSTAHSFAVDVPGISGELSFRISFQSEGFQDGVLVKVPVYQSVQTLKEAHSAVLRAGADKEALIAELKSEFVNLPAASAKYREISIIDMVKEAIPSKAEPEGEDVISLSEAYYIRKKAESLGMSFDADSTAKIFKKIMACNNADGGFAWFAGMSSSPVITALLLERFAKLGIDINSKEAVRFLDEDIMALDRPYWMGGISLEQYLYVRSYYPEVEFATTVQGDVRVYNKRLKEFKKGVKDYLLPGKERGLEGEIYSKARRLAVLDRLSASDAGLAFAKSVGCGNGVDKKLRKSLEADIVSLLEYAVDHRSGGIYYPNLVMPFRGLLENEAYAHSLLSDLFESLNADTHRVSEGIRLWLMLQKETQKWDADPAFVDAINSVLRAGDAVKETKVLLLEAEYEKPFEEIKAAGNGFTVQRKFYVEGKEIKEGESLKIGDKITAVYKIWSEENRSFVRLNAWREAALRPAQQLSGYYGWGISPLRISDWYYYRPSAYRNVRARNSEFFFDSFPEETMEIKEEFFVTQNGEFRAPVIEVESLYATHYRANASYLSAVVVR